jgi:hypothetical protein
MPLPPRRGSRRPRPYTSLAGFVGAGMAFGLLAASAKRCLQRQSGCGGPVAASRSRLVVAGVGVLAGAVARTWPRSAAVPAMFPAVLGYYMVDLWRGVYLALDPRDPLYRRTTPPRLQCAR